MPRPGVEDQWGLGGQPPVEVEVTVLSVRAPTARERIGQVRALWGVHPARRGVRLVRAAALGAAVTASVAIVVAVISGGGGAVREASAARLPGPAGVAAAYGYPVRCLSVTIALHDPRFARADFNRRLQCGEFTGDPTAIFERVHGSWRSQLDAVGYVCPVRSLPPAVQAELAVCP